MNINEKIVEDDSDNEIIQDVAIVELESEVSNVIEQHSTRQMADEPVVDISERVTGGLNKKDILILAVDDHADSVALLSFDLQKQGYRVVTASNGIEAIQVASLML